MADENQGTTIIIKKIKKSGHVAVYGIHFDTGKATIQADSESVLQQIVQLMKQDPALKRDYKDAFALD